MVGRNTIFLAAALILVSTGVAFAQVDFTPVANDALEWVNGVALLVASIVSGFVVRWLSTVTGVKNAELEAILARQMNDILNRAIGLAYATAKAKVNDPNSPLREVEFDNIFINMAANYAVKSAPDIIKKFGITRDRLEEMIIARLPDWMTTEQLKSSQATVAEANAKKEVDTA